MRKRNLDYKIVGLAILFLLCWMGYSPLACRGAVVWSDDFNDGNYDGWTICDNSTLNDGNWGFSGSLGYAPMDKPTISVAALVVNKPHWRIKGSYAAREALRYYLVKRRRAN